MDMKAIIGLIIAVVVIGGGAWYFSQGTEEGGTRQAGEENNAGTGSLADLMALGGSSTCTVSSEDPNAVSQGTVYVAGGKVRGDFTSTVDGASHDSHFINADGYIYTWSSAMPQGMKMADTGQMQEGEAEAPEGSVNPNVDYDYSCAPGVADESVFTPPAEVTFMDFSAGIPGMDGIVPAGYPQ